MRYIQLDGNVLVSEQLHDYLAQQLSLPAYYGKNLDALYDCLTECGETEITFLHLPEDMTAFHKIYGVFQAAALENDGLHLRCE